MGRGRKGAMGVRREIRAGEINQVRKRAGGVDADGCWGMMRGGDGERPVFDGEHEITRKHGDRCGC